MTVMLTRTYQLLLLPDQTAVGPAALVLLLLLLLGWMAVQIGGQ
jgi:hypothetical protein